MVRQSSRKAAQAKTKATAAAVAQGESESESKVEVDTRKTPKRKAARIEPEADGEDAENIDPVEEQDGGTKPAVKKRKTASKKDVDDTMPLAARTAVTSLKHAMHIGAHVSGAGGVQNAIQNAAHIGANAFALFLKSQRKWTSPPLADEAKTQFHAMLEQHGYDARKHILPHGSYLVNLAQADAAKATQAYDNFVDDLQRCEALGIGLYNFHPGSTGGTTMDSACARIAEQLNKAHKATSTVVTLLENMCGSGNVVGSRFEDLRDIIALVEDKSRVGVCIDTCHAFAAGYDLRTPEAFAKTMAEFDSVVGLKYLRAFHLNDSKAPFNSHRDLHANIGTGFLGLRAFHNIMNHAPLQGMPMVLETPIDEKGPDGKTVENKQIWADEIKLLESLIGMDVESAEFREKEAELQAKGAAERQKIQLQVDKKAEKDAKKGTRGRKKGKKKTDEDSYDESD
ncbi:6b5d16b0-17db-40a8-9100-22a9f8210bc3 [Thermothielavioides terrestris]|uniref:Apurinic-apyrimidinic endonuclease 1 n=1 Tax=Thermothielavioides terrestris TaxID=2587410 RepID=A0A3S4ETL5_9PEZI|nr:6b5d16b0-17db-40a8-9100-22a9f8210bc3 [Thermothielavioides terrestris]